MSNLFEPDKKSISLPCKLSLPVIFSNHMVLQQNRNIVIWGEAAPDISITVQLGDQKHITASDSIGKWRLELDPVPAGGPYRLMVYSSKGESILIDDIMFGEVWLCSGQSNMNFPLRNEELGMDEIKAANFPELRQIRLELPFDTGNSAHAPYSVWRKCDADGAASFSAVAYYFARELQKKMNVPVGLIVAALGDTLAETWIDYDVLKEAGCFRPLLSEWEHNMKDKSNIHKYNYIPGLFYDKVIHPIIPYTIMGVLWYQGESNALPDRSKRSLEERTHEYRELFPTLIHSWRKAWGQGDFPFYFVQLPNYSVGEDTDLKWAELRDAQLYAFKAVNNTGMVVTTDIGDAYDLHPVNKHDIGYRLARWALANKYGYDVAYSGPVYKSMAVENSKVILYFDYTEEGLYSPSGKSLSGFEITGENGFFITAEAELKSNTVVVWHESIKHPTAVRYAWCDNPACTLYNKTGLPASPFRTY